MTATRADDVRVAAYAALACVVVACLPQAVCDSPPPEPPAIMRVADDQGRVCLGEDPASVVCMARTDDGAVDITTPDGGASPVRINGVDVLGKFESIVSRLELLEEGTGFHDDAGCPDGAALTSAGEPARNCRQLLEAGVETDGPRCLQTDKGVRRLFCDQSGGGWTLVGQINHANTLNAYREWLRQDVATGNLASKEVEDNAISCIDAVAMAVNEATTLRLSNSAADRWLSWRMNGDRSTSTFWHHEATQPTVWASRTGSERTTVTSHSRDFGTCYTNAYGIMPLDVHGGSYPGAWLNADGNTGGGDLCSAVAVLRPGSVADGWTQNTGGGDAPVSETDWPNALNHGGADVSVWLRPDCTPYKHAASNQAAWSCADVLAAGETESGPYCIKVADGARELYCDLTAGDGGWTLVGKVDDTRSFDMWHNWLVTDVNADLLTTRDLDEDTVACIDARDIAVNRATHVRMSNAAGSNWVQWRMNPERAADSYWTHDVGYADVWANYAASARQVMVESSWGDSGVCYTNKWGIMPIQVHGGSYPGAFLNAQGNTGGGDMCMAIGVMQQDSTGDGWGPHNTGGADGPTSETDWPGSSNSGGSHALIWVNDLDDDARGVCSPYSDPDSGDEAWSCKDVLDAGESTDGAYCIQTYKGPRKLYCDLSGGGWTKVAQVDHTKDLLMAHWWLISDVNTHLLTASTIVDGSMGCVDARDMAVNHATTVKLTNSDRSKSLAWDMNANRAVSTYWTHSVGYSTVWAERGESTSVTVTDQDGTTGTCYTNKYGLMPIEVHGGSYPGTWLNADGNTGGGDLCSAVGVIKQGEVVDGWSQNTGGHDGPTSDSDWPGASNSGGARVSVWLK